MATIKSFEGTAFGTGEGTRQLEMNPLPRPLEIIVTHITKEPVMHLELLGNPGQRSASERGLEYQIHHHPCPILSLDSYI